MDIGAFERPIVTNPPTIYLVTNSSSDPSVVGSLPYVINEANANTDLAGSVIQFDPTVFATPQTITLAGTLAYVWGGRDLRAVAPRSDSANFPGFFSILCSVFRDSVVTIFRVIS